jgi:hypothetical protein
MIEAFIRRADARRLDGRSKRGHDRLVLEGIS